MTGSSALLLCVCVSDSGPTPPALLPRVPPPTPLFLTLTHSLSLATRPHDLPHSHCGNSAPLAAGVTFPPSPHPSSPLYPCRASPSHPPPQPLYHHCAEGGGAPGRTPGRALSLCQVAPSPLVFGRACSARRAGRIKTQALSKRAVFSLMQ